MKKTSKRPDGTEETLEGSPEELADYERRTRPDDKTTVAPATPRPPADSAGLQDMVKKLRGIESDPWRDCNPDPWKVTPPKKCNPECHACSRGPWWGIYPPPCICVPSCITYTAFRRFTWGADNAAAAAPWWLGANCFTFTLGGRPTSGAGGRRGPS